jgi:hypothetical protein
MAAVCKFLILLARLSQLEGYATQEGAPNQHRG